MVALALAAVATEAAKKTVYYYHPGPAKTSFVKVVLGSTDPNVDNHYSVGG